jgi:uncharacterized protein (DUF58 family)
LTHLLPVPLPRLAAVAAMASVAVAVLPLPTWWSLLVVNAAVALLAVVDARMAVDPADVRVTRQFPEVVGLGEDVRLAWRLENPVARHIWVEVADQLAPSLGAGQRRLAVTLPASGTAVVATTMRPARRGRFDVTELAVRVAGPLRVAARQTRLPSLHTIRVYPPFGSRDDAELRLRRARLLEVGLRSAQGRGGGTDFDSLREYTPDDESRRLDWPATARTGKPIVRTYRAERNQTVLLLVDTGRVMAGRVAGVPRLEHAVDAVMMLTTVATRLGDRVGVVAFSDEVRAVLPPSRGRAQLARIAGALYDIEPELVESDYEGAFVSALGRFRRRSLLVVFTDLAEQAVRESLLPALPLVARDHLVVLAGVQDPDVLAWSRSAPSGAEDGYRAAAAVASLEERRRLVAQLRGIGVTVVDAPPGRMAPALADAYLRVKATGRL